MTDRVSYLTIALEADTRTDDVEALVAAISQLRGVLSVRHGIPVDGNEWASRVRIRQELVLGLIGSLKSDV